MNNDTESQIAELRQRVQIQRSDLSTMANRLYTLHHECVTATVNARRAEEFAFVSVLIAGGAAVLIIAVAIIVIGHCSVP